MLNHDANQNINKKIRKVFEPPNCSICLDPMLTNLGIFIGCGHVFHYQCAVISKNQSTKCPNCRERSCEIQKVRYTIEEIEGVELQMQEMLTALSQDDQFKVADLLQKYEDSVTEMHKAIQKVKNLEENFRIADDKCKLLESQHQGLNDKIKALNDRKQQLKQDNRSLEHQLISMKALNESSTNEARALRTSLLEYQQLENLKKIIQSEDEDAYLKQMKNQLPIQRYMHKVYQLQLKQNQAQEVHDLFKLRSSQVKGIQQELLAKQEEFELMKKKLTKHKAQMEEMQRENLQLKDFVKTRRERSQENSMHQVEMITQKSKEIDQEMKNIMDPYSYLKKRKVQEVNPAIRKPPQFGKNSLLNQQGFHNSISSLKHNNNF